MTLPYPENVDKFVQKPSPEEAAWAVSQFLSETWPRSVEVEDWFPDWLITQLLRFFRGEKND